MKRVETFLQRGVAARVRARDIPFGERTHTALSQYVTLAFYIRGLVIGYPFTTIPESSRACARAPAPVRARSPALPVYTLYSVRDKRAVLTSRGTITLYDTYSGSVHAFLSFALSPAGRRCK